MKASIVAESVAEMTSIRSFWREGMTSVCGLLLMAPFIALFTALLTALSTPSVADDLKVAVAANFKSVLGELSQQFEQKSGHRVLISSASSGVLFNQISHGAPFDVFLSADDKRPKTLEQQGLILSGSRKPYAYGRLVLWRNESKPIGKKLKPLTVDDLAHWQGRLAMANPATAPYGLAAQQSLKKLGLWQGYQGRIVQGASIQQAWQFVASHNVELGLVARSQVLDQASLVINSKDISFVPSHLYDPIVQELVILKDSRSQKLAGEFVRFLLSAGSQKRIESMGYFPATETNIH